MIQIKKFNLDEKIYGNMATVFHRTSVSNLVNEVYTDGFKPGSGDMYGKGFYATYELSSQERSDMKHYGNIIIKFIVPIEDFFIFDYDEFIKSPNYKKLGRPSKSDFIIEQGKYFNIPETRLINVYKREAEEFYDSRNKFYTSDIALAFLRDINLDRYVEGIIFTGRRDGHVLVSYNPKNIIPVSYREDGGKDFKSVERNKDYLKQWSKQKGTFDKNVLHYGQEESLYLRIQKVIEEKGIMPPIREIQKTTDDFWKDYNDYLREFYDDVVYEKMSNNELLETFVDEDKIRPILYEYFSENLDLMDSYDYGYDNPEQFIDEEPDDDDEWSEEQREQAALQAESEAMEEALRDTFRDYMNGDIDIPSNVEEEVFDFDNIYKNEVIANWLESIETYSEYEDWEEWMRYNDLEENIGFMEKILSVIK